MPRGTRPILVDEEFYALISARVIRDKKVCRNLRRKTGDKNYFETYGDLTKSLIPELKRLFK